MDRSAAIDQIKQHCNEISRELMRIHPAVQSLNDSSCQNVLYESLHELTKNVEIIKKHLLKLQAADNSPEL